MKRAAEAEILEKFGPYELVARFVKGEHWGVLWRSGKKLVELTATSNAEAKKLVESRFYEMRREQLQEQGDAVPTEKKMVEALMYIWPHLNTAQKKILQAQYRAAERRMTTPEMAEVAGYKSHHAVNLFYGQAGFMLFSELPRVLPIHKQTGAPIYSFTLSVGVGEPEDHSGKTWIWEMRPEVARGLELAGLVST